MEAPLLISSKHTPASFLLHTDNTLLCIQSFRLPPSEGIFCCVPYIPVDTHSYGNEDSSQCRFFSFYINAGLRSSRVASHVNTCIPVRRPGSLLMLIPLPPPYVGLKPNFFSMSQLFQWHFCLVSLFLFKKLIKILQGRDIDSHCDPIRYKTLI